MKTSQTVSSRLEIFKQDLERLENGPPKASLVRAFVSFKLTFLSSFFVRGGILKGTRGFVDALFAGFEVFFKKLY